MAIKPKNEIGILLDLMDRAYDKKSWHGTNLRGSLRGLKVNQLIWRPGQNRHNIWEIALHCAYWKYVALRAFVDIKRGSFPRSPSNFPKIPQNHDEKSWLEDCGILKSYHTQLRVAVSAFRAENLNRVIGGFARTYLELIQGMASHDLYHAGQIQLLKRLQTKK